MTLEKSSPLSLSGSGRCYKASPEPSLLHAAGPHLFSACLHRSGAYSHDHLHGPSLHSMKQLHIFLILGAPELNVIFQVGSHKNGVEGRINFLDLLATVLLLQPSV